MNGEDRVFEAMPSEVALAHGVPGRFAGRLEHEVIVMEIDADGPCGFPSSEEVNAGLRMLIKAAASVNTQATVRAS